MTERERQLEMPGFEYDTVGQQVICEDAASRIFQINATWTKMTLRMRLEAGRLLNTVRCTLPHGAYGKWFEWKFGKREGTFSEDMTRRWRVMADRVDKNPLLLETLERFESVAAAEQFCALPEPVQVEVVRRQAFTWSAYRAATWDAAMRETLTDPDRPYGERYGVVLEAIEDAQGDPALESVARDLYEENRDTFARLADRTPAEMDVETRIDRKPTPPPQVDKPRAQLVEADEGLWLCRFDGETYRPVAPVASHVRMWYERGEPTVLAAFPATSDGPAAKSWQGAGVDAFVKAVGASTLGSVYGEIL